jgi:hypothetical protein
MDKATKMAKANVNIWDQVRASGTGIAIMLGKVLQPALTPVLSLFIKMGQATLAWTERHPTLTKYLGIATLAVFGLVAAVSAFNLIGGITTMMLTGLSGALLFVKGATVLFSAALWANPITWIVAGVALLVAALVGLYVYWDKVVAVLNNSLVFQLVRVGVLSLVEAFGGLWQGIKMIYRGWAMLLDFIGVTTVFNNLLIIFEKIGAVIGYVVDLIGGLASSIFNITNDMAGFLKSVGDNGVFSTLASLVFDDNSTELPTLNSGSADPSAGGSNSTLHNISSAVSNNNQRSVTVGKIEMHGNNKSGRDIHDELLAVSP